MLNSLVDRGAVVSNEPQPRTHPLRWVLGVVVVSRVVVALGLYAGDWQRGGVPVASGPGVDNVLLRPLTWFDAHWYLEISGAGYEKVSSVFSPLYPWLIGFGGVDPVRRALVGVLISTAAFAVAAVVLYRLTELEYGERIARRVVLITALHPLAAVWSFVYTESLALLFVVSAFWFARRGRWAWAIAPALAIGWTRNVGLVVAAALALEWWRQYRGGALLGEECDEAEALRRRPNWTGILAIGSPLVGFVGFLLWVRHRLGPGAGTEAQRGFGRTWDIPIRPVVDDMVDLVRAPVTVGGVLSLLTIICALSFCWLLRKRQPLGYAVLILGVLAMHLTLARVNPPRTLGAARYLLVTFPFAQGLALFWPRSRAALRPWVYGAAIMATVAVSFLLGRGQFELG